MKLEKAIEASTKIREAREKMERIISTDDEIDDYFLIEELAECIDSAESLERVEKLVDSTRNLLSCYGIAI